MKELFYFLLVEKNGKSQQLTVTILSSHNTTGLFEKIPVQQLRHQGLVGRFERGDNIIHNFEAHHQLLTFQVARKRNITSASGTPLDFNHILDTFLNVKGYPVLSISRKEPQTLKLKQEVYLNPSKQCIPPVESRLCALFILYSRLT